jgi:hypothetical protein
VRATQEARLAQGIGLMTAATGASVLVAPRPILAILGAGHREPTTFFFRVVGMFMVATGGLLADGAREAPPSRMALRWSFVAKLGAATALTLGVRSKRLGRLSLAVGAIDGLSAVLLAKLLLETRD